jgi:MoaA/NifB/PqqE/SkfB family radical SAM enzyme
MTSTIRDAYRYDFLLHATVPVADDWGFKPPSPENIPLDPELLCMELESLRNTGAWQESTERLMRMKCLNYELAMREWHGRFDRANARPISVQINRDDHCNLKCVYCRPVGTLFPGLKTMPRDKWLALTNLLLPSAIEFLPFCWGEPLLPSAEFDLACYASQQYMVQMAIITHLNTLDEKNANLFVNHVSRALISVDTPNHNRYRELRHGGKLDTVERNVAKLHSLARTLEKPMPYLGVSAVIMKQNLTELPALIRWAADQGIQGVYAGRLVAPDGIRTWASGELVDLTSNIYHHVYLECKLEAKRLGIELCMFDPDNPIGNGRMCPCPWQHAYISSDGALSFCNFSREIVLDNEPLTKDYWVTGKIDERRKIWDNDFRCAGCQSTDYDGRPGVSQFRGQ